MQDNMHSVPFKQDTVYNTMNNDYSKYRPDYELPKVTHILPITDRLSVYCKYFGENWPCFIMLLH